MLKAFGYIEIVKFEKFSEKLIKLYNISNYNEISFGGLIIIQKPWYGTCGMILHNKAVSMLAYLAGDHWNLKFEQK